MASKKRVALVGGGGGFIGGHLIAKLRDLGYDQIRSVDIKPLDEWYQVHDDVENIQADLKLKEACMDAVSGVTEVYNLAADMGGMGFIENNRALCMLSVLINTHLLEAAKELRALACTTPISRSAKTWSPSKKKTPTPRCRKMATVGKSSLANGCAATSAKTLA